MHTAFLSFKFENVKESDLEKAAHYKQESRVLEHGVGLAEECH